MQRRLIAILILLVCLPLVLLAWLGVRLARNEQELLDQRVEELLETRLRDMDSRIQQLLDARARALLTLTDVDSYDAGELRALIRTAPEIDHLFVQAQTGQVLHPPVAGELSRTERDFLVRTRTIFDDRLLWQPTGDAADTLAGPVQVNPQQSVSSKVRAAPTPVLQQSLRRSDYGWYAWYWESGLNLVFWRRDNRGNIVGAELNRARLLADIINDLPVAADDSSTAAGSGAIELVDSRSRVLAMWGAHPGDRGMVRAEIVLGAPFGAWRLRHHQSDEVATGAAVLITGVAGFLSVAAALVGLSLYFYRESMRDIREAAQRVRFVSQVSHELRTPLTNIRLYAELLEQRVGDDDPKARDQLGVIVTESHRLSRLIGNVLAFARHRRGRLRLNPVSAVLDDAVGSVVEQFRPSLLARGVEIAVECAAPEPFLFDTDAVEQVLANLINNVEKYAAAGGRVVVSTRQSADQAVLTVTDRGPGIPRDKWEAVFDPWVRLSDRLNEGVSGTGMGLSISREIARLHGGDLRIVPSSQGACFQLVLPVAQPGSAT